VAPTSGRQIAAEFPRQPEWVRIVAADHVLFGQVVRVVRRLRGEDGVHIIVESSERKHIRLPLTATDAAPGAKVVAPMLFAPGALRALAQLVRWYYAPTPAEVSHGDRQAPDIVENVSRRDPRPNGRTVGRPAASAAAEPPPEGNIP
jgi:hypothetical protein